MPDNQWISVKERLPPEGKYVVGRHNRGTWIDSDDQENVNCVIVKLKRGISASEREKTGSKTYSADDEWGNNLVPYSFHEFGVDNFNGQSITHWMPLPEPPVKDEG